MPNGEDFSVDVYKQMLFTNIDNQVARGELSKGKAKELKAQIEEAITTGATGYALPDWGTVYLDWLQLRKAIRTERQAVRGEVSAQQEKAMRSKGNILVPNRVMEYEGKYYDPDSLMPVNPQTASRDISEYFGANEGKLTEYQRAQLGKARQDLLESTRRWEIEQRQEQTEFMREMEFGREQLGLQRERFAWEREEAGESQRLREQLQWTQKMAQLEGPADWIKRWQMANDPNFNPMMAREQQQAAMYTPQAQMAGLEQSLTSLWGQRSAILDKALADPFNPEVQQQTQEQLQGINKQIAVEQKTSQNVGEALAADLAFYEQHGQSMYGAPNRPQLLPDVPKWLPEFVPTLQAGEEITKEPIVTPSGQQWGRTPGAQREGLRGYAEWTGRRPYEDILQEMRSMLPRDPRGAGQQRFTPARQMA